jgi:polygalacturonase
MFTITRRRFLQHAAGAGPALLLRRPLAGFAFRQAGAADPWARADAIVKGITTPRFPSRDFDITTHGAVGDGAKPCTDAIRQAIAACRAAGGGRVVVPAGRFLTGPIRLQSGVDLHLTEKATLAFSGDHREYLPVVLTRWEGVELMNYSPFIYAFEAENIAVTGTGTLDGQADAQHWWDWRAAGPAAKARQFPARERLMKLQASGVPVAERIFGDGHFLRPNFIQPYRSRTVLIEGVTILNSPMWEIHPVLCRGVTVRGVTVRSHGPNNDGCDPESCRDVLIDGCTFDTGDDCIALKSGRNDDGRRLNVPVENVVIRNCSMKDGHGGVVIGSEISGGARNVFAEACRMDSPQLDRALRIKTNSVRGGTIEGIYLRDVTIGQVAEAVVTINFFYEEGDAGTFPPVVRDVHLQNVTSRKSEYALLLRGYERAPITNVRLSDCRFDGVAKPDVLEHVKGLEFDNVTVNGQPRRKSEVRSQKLEHGG